MILLALDMMTPTHQSFGLWKHPEADTEQYLDLDFWTDHARMLESAGFDALFFADVAGIYDVFGGDGAAAIGAGMQYPTLDPMLLASALASATHSLGIAVTASVSYESPYLLARKFATLDHLSRGRIGWNIVTSYQRSAMENITGTAMLAHDDRYERAEEFMEVSYQLWESSIAEGALLADSTTNRYFDPEKVHPLQHRGQYFAITSPASTSPGPQRTPFLFQAGSSPRGIDFALRHAEAIFVSGTSEANVAALVATIETRARIVGRDRGSFTIICSITVIAGSSEDAAQQRYSSYRELMDTQAALALFSGWTGMDLSRFPAEAPLEDVAIEGNRSALQSFTSLDPDRRWLIRDLAEFLAIGARGAVLVGDGEGIADKLQRWIEATGVDGFAIDYGIRSVDMQQFCVQVCPVLQHKGLIQPPLRPAQQAPISEHDTGKHRGTLRERILGSSRLSAQHPGRFPLSG